MPNPVHATASPVCQTNASPGHCTAVTIDSVDVRPVSDGEQGLAELRACVHLGTLLPADVHVELLSHPASPGRRRPRAGFVSERMASIQSYANGRFIFAARIPLSRLEDPEGCAVRVTHADGSAHLPPTVRWIPHQCSAIADSPKRLPASRTALRSLLRNPRSAR